MNTKSDGMRARQPKIKNAFDKQLNRSDALEDPEFAELMEDNKSLKEKLDELEMHSFQLQQSSLPQPRRFQVHHGDEIAAELNSIGGEVSVEGRCARLQARLDHYLRYYGLQVVECSDTDCSIVFDVNLGDGSLAQYAVHFVRPVGGGKRWVLQKYHLPLGFPLNHLSHLEVMSMEYLLWLSAALNTQHSRLQQIEELQARLPQVREYHLLSGMKVELCFSVSGDEALSSVAVGLEYRPLDIRPNKVTASTNVVTEYSESLIKHLQAQLEPLHRLPLVTGLLESLCQSHHSLQLTRPEHINLEPIGNLHRAEADMWQRDYYSDEERISQVSARKNPSEPVCNPDGEWHVGETSVSSDDGFAENRQEMLKARQKNPKSKRHVADNCDKSDDSMHECAPKDVRKPLQRQRMTGSILGMSQRVGGCNVYIPEVDKQSKKVKKTRRPPKNRQAASKDSVSSENSP